MINLKISKHKDILQYLETSTTKASISFDTNIDINNINSFGNIKIDFMNKMFKPKRINLSPIIKQEGESVNGYKIRLKWKMEDDDKDNTEEFEFIVKYNVEIQTPQFIDDEKDNDGNDNIWEIFNYTHGDNKIESNDGINFELSIMDKVFEINKRYTFCIECLSKVPYHLKLMSNIETILVDLDDRPKGKIIKIPLIYSSHRNDNNGPPTNLFKNDDSYYWSAFYNDFKKGEDDWMIFQFDDNFFPIKFEILNIVDIRNKELKI